MARKYRKKSLNFDDKTKKVIFIGLFLFFWVVAFMAKNGTLLEDNFIKVLNSSFWEYYKWIFWPVLIGLWVFLIKEKNQYFDMFRFLWLMLFFISITTLIWLFNPEYSAYFNMYNFLDWIISKNISILVFFIGVLISFYILFRISYIEILSNMWEKIQAQAENAKKERKAKKEVYKLQKTKIKKSAKKDEFEEKQEEIKRLKDQLEKEKQKEEKSQLKISDIPKKIILKKPETKKIVVEKREEDCKMPVFSGKWELPGITLLSNRWWKIKFNKADIEHKMLEIQSKLLQFRISVEMESYRVWPTVIQFRLKPNTGVKLNKIENLKKDLTIA
jgi:DNA segregation ATPase FtsK/SpoIIIE-like protein